MKAVTDSEKIAELISQIQYMGGLESRLAEHLISNGVTLREHARTIDEWGEDNGDVLWWKFPIEEPPYVGSPLDANWPGYHTHWTPIAIPEPPKDDC